MMMINNKCIICSDTGMFWKGSQGGDYEYCKCNKGKEIRMSFDQDLNPNYGAEKLVLTFEYLRNANIQRCTSKDGFSHPLGGWSVAEWGAATGGELGEALNIAKKLIRIRDGVPGNKESEAELNKMLADELADVAIYLDLWAASQGIDLEQAIISKFNKTSDKIGSTIKL